MIFRRRRGLSRDVEYLSSYPYREAFTENFNQAVSTDILSIAYGVHEANGFASDVRADRYQGLKRVAVPATPTRRRSRRRRSASFMRRRVEMASTDHARGQRAGCFGMWRVRRRG